MAKDKSKFKQFIEKAGKIVPDAINVVGTLVTGNYVGAAQQLGGILRKASEKKENETKKQEADRIEAQNLLYEFEHRQNEFVLEKFKQEEKSRERASKNSKPETNSKLQVVMAYFSLVGFVVFAIANFYLMYVSITTPNIEIGTFVISSMAYYQGVFTGLLFTLKDYLFGGSFSNNEKSIENIDYNSAFEIDYDSISKEE